MPIPPTSKYESQFKCLARNQPKTFGPRHSLSKLQHRLHTKHFLVERNAWVSSLLQRIPHASASKQPRPPFSTKRQLGVKLYELAVSVYGRRLKATTCRLDGSVHGTRMIPKQCSKKPNIPGTCDMIFYFCIHILNIYIHIYLMCTSPLKAFWLRENR